MSIQPLTNTLVDKTNFKIRIHASQTLLKYKTIEQYGGTEGYLIVWQGLLTSFENLSTYTSFQDEKYVRKLDQNFVELFLHLTSLLDLTKEHSLMMDKFLSENSHRLLKGVIEYLRKELKISDYSAMNDESSEAFDKDMHEEITHDAILRPKMEKLQQGIKKVVDLTKMGEHISVSFGVLDKLSMLVDTPVEQYRSLEILRTSRVAFSNAMEVSDLSKHNVLLGDFNPYVKTKNKEGEEEKK